MNQKSKDEIRERLTNLANYLNEQSLFSDDTLSWGAKCLQSFLDGTEKSLDHAFGLQTSKKGPKPMQSGEHDDWVLSAFIKVLSETPKGREWPDTKTLAKIGRYYGLGGIDSANADDHGIASELKRILSRYDQIIIKQFSEKITERLNK